MLHTVYLTVSDDLIKTEEFIHLWRSVGGDEVREVMLVAEDVDSVERTFYVTHSDYANMDRIEKYITARLADLIEPRLMAEKRRILSTSDTLDDFQERMGEYVSERANMATIKPSDKTLFVTFGYTSFSDSYTLHIEKAEVNAVIRKRKIDGLLGM